MGNSWCDEDELGYLGWFDDETGWLKSSTWKRWCFLGLNWEQWGIELKDGGFTMKNWEFNEKNWDFLHDWNGIQCDIMGYHGKVFYSSWVLLRYRQLKMVFFIRIQRVSDHWNPHFKWWVYITLSKHGEKWCLTPHHPEEFLFNARQFQLPKTVPKMSETHSATGTLQDPGSEEQYYRLRDDMPMGLKLASLDQLKQLVRFWVTQGGWRCFDMRGGAGDYWAILWICELIWPNHSMTKYRKCPGMWWW